MLSGFAYPIDQFQFSVNVPGMVTQNPSFVSGYHQANIEKDLTYSYSGGNIAGRSWGALKDHETPVLKRRLLSSIGFLLVLMYFSMGHNMFCWPLPAFFDGNHVAVGIVQMLLAGIVMVINRKFFVK
jgi:hypothetical protein